MTGRHQLRTSKASRDKWFTYSFKSLLWIPLLLIVLTRDPAFPLPQSVGDLFFFPGEFKYFIGNHFPLRDSLAKVHSLALMKMNGPSEVGRVVVGQADWMFLRMDRDMSTMSVSQTKLLAFRDQFEQRAALCRSIGAEYRVMIVPTKENVYAEFLPDRYRKFAIRTSEMSVIGRFMRTKSERIPTIDLLARFMREKEISDLYFKSDSHWNEFGGFIACEELLRSLAGGTNHFSATKYSIEMRVSPGGNEAKILGIQDRVTEDYPRVIVADGRNPTRDNGSPVEFDTINLDDFNLQGTRTRCPEAPYESVLVFHDSFGVALVPFVSRQFKAATFIWHGFLPNVVTNRRPKVVMDVYTSF
jgi:alginate O-acetyltransferase complex protein AlgJ